MAMLQKTHILQLYTKNLLRIYLDDNLLKLHATYKKNPVSFSANIAKPAFSLTS